MAMYEEEEEVQEIFAAGLTFLFLPDLRYLPTGTYMSCLCFIIMLLQRPAPAHAQILSRLSLLG